MQPTPRRQPEERAVLRTLLVEDQDGAARLVQEMLRESALTRFEVIRVSRLDEALPELSRARIDVVLLDLTLPDCDGLDTLARVQQHAPRVPIVVMTGNDDEALDQAAVERGAHGYLVKAELSAGLLIRQLRHAIEHCRMIHDLEEAREHARQLATRDPLTGVANRLVLDDRLSRLIESSRRSGSRVGILVLDVDRFKAINDAFGHAVGDEVLRCVAQRITRQVRSSDTVARFGGDEFVILLTNLRREMDAARVAEKILQAVSQPIAVNGHEFLTSGSIGVATYPGDAPDGRTLLRAADTAMYHSKRGGSGRYQFYGAGMTEAAVERLVIEDRLRGAIERSELSLCYQPYVDLESWRLTGAEALLRWRSPELGSVSPVKFIPVAEETGQILRIGAWVLGLACQQARAWRDAGHRDLRMSVNVSPRQIRDVSFPRIVEAALDEAGLEGDALTIEIIESSLLDPSGATERTLAAIKGMGIRIEIDDFGTGYSCLAELKRVPFDAIKIDRRFVMGLPADPKDVMIVSAMIALARGFRAETVAEGVENEEQLESVRELGCPAAQGFLFSEPVPAEAFGRLLTEGLGPRLGKPESR